ncbi:TIGR03643 family protein [Kaistella palustris]|uniref:TIGR03643 family protein n=1 Tax=Kaistella palustris TaxID=493376 RepID=UPI0004836FA1|nr:TIGR03643 family protein [Kaistella palustris]
MILSPEQTNRVIEMAWEDRTPFEAINYQFDLNEKDVITLMRKELKRNSFNLWRKRVNSGVSHKHLFKRSAGISRFRCSRQRMITGNHISKR